MNTTKYLLISDDGPGFRTIEGEGRLIGEPSIFMRLFGCNLTCKGFATPESPWGCDSFISWSKKNTYTFEQMFEFYEREGFIDDLKNGYVWKITGGEPMLRQMPLISFIQAFKGRYNFIPRIDIETNATIQPLSEWNTDFNATFTTSPKLLSNGDPEERTYVPEVLRFHVEQGSCFKFVVQTEDDVKEIYRKYVNSDEIALKEKLIWLMPAAGSRDEHVERAPFVAELAKKYRLKFSPRLQLLVWNKALKV